MQNELPKLTDPVSVGADGFPIVLGEISVQDRLLFLSVADEKERAAKLAASDRQIIQRLRASLFARMENRRRLEEARRDEPLHYECLETFDLITDRTIEVVVGAHLARETRDEGLFDETGNYVALDQLRRINRRERAKPSWQRQR